MLSVVNDNTATTMTASNFCTSKYYSFSQVTFSMNTVHLTVFLQNVGSLICFICSFCCNFIFWLFCRCSLLHFRNCCICCYHFVLHNFICIAIKLNRILYFEKTHTHTHTRHTGFEVNICNRYVILFSDVHAGRF